jgi:hypothetical protein
MIKKPELKKLPQTSLDQGLKKPIPNTQRPRDPSPKKMGDVGRSTEPQRLGGKISYQPTNDEDDDQDMRMLISNENFGEDFELQDPVHDEITKHIHQLKYGDLSKRVDSLVSLNEMISAVEQNKGALI